MAIIYLSFPLYACQTTTISPTKESLFGSYEASGGSLLDRAKWVLLKGKFAYNNTHQLTLNSNNTYRLKGCKCEAKGQWLLNNDTLMIVNKQLDNGNFLGSCQEEFTFKYVVWDDGSLFQVFPDYETITLMRKINNKALSSNKQSRR